MKQIEDLRMKRLRPFFTSSVMLL